MTNKTLIYQEQISPLVAQIHDICTKNGIAMLADFSVSNNEGFMTTTADENGEFPQDYKAAVLIIRGLVTAFLVPNGATPEDGEVGHA